MGYVHVAHDCKIGNYNILANYTGLSGHVTLDDHVTLGVKWSSSIPKNRSYVYTGAGSLIDRNVPPYSTGYGTALSKRRILSA